MSGSTKLAGILLFCSGVSAGCSPGVQARSATAPADGADPIEQGYAALRSWPGLQGPDHEALSETLRFHGSDLPYYATFTRAPGGTGRLFVVHVGWSVAVCYLDAPGRVRDVLSYTARGGYSLSWDLGPVVVLHRHGGTGMSHDERLRIGLKDGRLTARSLPDEDAPKP